MGVTQDNNYERLGKSIREERLAQGLCDEILAAHPLVERVRLEVKKPWAPIGLPLDYVSVCIERSR